MTPHDARAQIARAFSQEGHVPPGIQAFDDRTSLDPTRQVSDDAGSIIDEPDLPPVARLKPEVIWPFPFEMTSEGLFAKPGEERGEWLADPFQVHCKARTGEGTHWSLVLSFRDDDGRLQIINVPFSDLAAGDAAEIRRDLAGRGLRMAITRGARERFASALAGVLVSLRATLVSQSGWHADGTVFVLPNFAASAPERQGEPILFRTNGQVAHFRTVGDLAEWQTTVASLAVGHDRLLFALGLAFAGPLLEPTGAEGGAFNLVGPSSVGKTTATHIAGSVWGGGGPLNFALSWRITDNALEGAASAHNDALLILDELGQCEPRALEAAAYALTGGSGKGRARADGEARARTRWRVCVFSTGEIALAQRIAEGGPGKQARGGQAVRFVDVPADAGKGLGLFDHLGGFPDARALAEAIRIRTGQQFGSAGPAFIERVISCRDETAKQARAAIEAFTAAVVPNGASGQVMRVAQRFGLVAAAGELAITLGVLPFEEGAVMAATGNLFRAWVSRRGGVGASEARDAVTAIRSFVEQHGAARFVPARRGIDESTWRAQKIAGFRLSGDAPDGDGDYLFHGAGWAEATTGLDPHAAADALAAAGFLLKDASGKRKRAERVGDKTMRVYRVRHQILEGEDD